ncbi:DUF177 domain-containing protein [Fusibacter sp. 3D3]|uniref:YceD family protein n=1 Tax=Fusibacter sp. 3D3 TaxID=1048380 RepID=UPI000852AB47|nr:DUF177 domain-containing protein [Fusibacter sp. 3D3]GAU78766.1 protein clustered with ribosomal protein L32p [Fusibacter sp. 3D3]
MNLDLSKVINGLKSVADFQFDLTLTDEFLKEINAIEASKFSMTGDVKTIEKRLMLTFDYKGIISFECHRCLAEVKLNLSSCVTRALVEQFSEDEDDRFAVIESGAIDLIPILEEDILLNLPPQILCDKGCNGICPKCGTDLNTGNCTCNDEKIDPRLEALKNLFT